jgi:serine/threonine protein kinase
MTQLMRGLPPGAVIDGFKVLGELGDGGFGFVYLAEKDGKRYALKVARHREASGDDKRTHARTMRELAILALLAGQPHIVRLRGQGYLPEEAGGHLYLVLEFVDGWTLAEWVERKHPTVQEVLRVFEKLASALAYMHSRGVLHRDLKLVNVLIRKGDGEPVIIDLGAATHPLAEDLTEEGLPPGTDRFRAPEQFQFLRTHKEEHRARYAFQVADEIFAYGAMLYDVLTDPRPTEDREREVLNHQRRTPEPAHELNPRVPEAVSDWVASLLAREPHKRPVDTEALRREAAELAALATADYLEPVHPPSEQRLPAPVEEGASELDMPELARKRPWAGLRALVNSFRAHKRAVGSGLFVAAAVAAALVLSLRPGHVPPPAPVSAPPVAALPRPASAGSVAPVERDAAMSPSAPAGAVDTGPAAPTGTQKEGSTVTIQKPEAPTQARTPRGQKPPSAAVCKTLAFLSAVAMGCTSIPTRPEPFECPQRVQDIMTDELGWEFGEVFWAALDDRFDVDSREVYFRPGAEVVSRVPDTGIDDEQEKLAPPGTLFWGRVYVDPKHPHRDGEPAGLIVKYERAKLPGKEEVPVCVFGVTGKVYSIDKEGVVKASNSGSLRVRASFTDQYL